jgi:hypothetical protein
LKPSKMPSVGKSLGLIKRLLKNWRSGCEYKIQTSTSVSRWRKSLEVDEDYVEMWGANLVNLWVCSKNYKIITSK